MTTWKGGIKTKETARERKDERWRKNKEERGSGKRKQETRR